MSRGRDVPEEAVAGRLDALGEDDVSDILFTSGTTGNPKGAVTTHGQNVRLYRAYGGGLGYGPDDVFLIINPFFHSFGYKAGWLVALMHGATVLPHAVFETGRVLQRIAAERVTLLPGPPTIFQSLLAGPYDAYDLSSLRVSITGAASVPVTLIEEMRGKLEMGIGLHSGTAILGRIGAAGKGSAAGGVTALGDTVNTASRLEGACKELDMQAIISKAVLDRAEADFGGLETQSIEIRGRAGALDVVMVKRATQLPALESPKP